MGLNGRYYRDREDQGGCGLGFSSTKSTVAQRTYEFKQRLASAWRRHFHRESPTLHSASNGEETGS
jgi:hypothetical protein